MHLTLKRRAYLADRTMGTLYVGNDVFHTLERPWIPSMEHLGGKNNESCVPEGTYTLLPFDSDNHPNCFSLHNEALDVWVIKGQEPGRFAILIHVGNYIKDIIGCIAPGLTGDDKNVWSSGDAMEKIRELVADDEEHTITIESRGTPQ